VVAFQAKAGIIRPGLRPIQMQSSSNSQSFSSSSSSPAPFRVQNSTVQGSTVQAPSPTLDIRPETLDFFPLRLVLVLVLVLVLDFAAINLSHAQLQPADTNRPSTSTTPQRSRRWQDSDTNFVASWSGTATNSAGQTILTVTVDTSQARDLDDWGRRAGQLCALWYPKICDLLASDGFTAPKTVRLRFRDGRGVAATGGGVIRINSAYVRRATNDFGMVIHELTHVVQSYHRGDTPGWLTEGIADYIRLTHYEPQARRPRIDPDKASYTDAYKTTAIFLEWAEKTHDPHLVKKLNQAAREGTFQLTLFKDYTGKSIDDLWSEYTDTLRQKSTASSPPSKS
jgi:hypothetical protein